MQIHQSAEDYLETILMLTQRMGRVRSIDVVNELGYTKASVSIAMKKLRENGYIAVDGEGNLTLLDPGREIAERIYSRHRLLTHFFMQLGVDEKIAAEDACKAEHILSVSSLRICWPRSASKRCSTMQRNPPRTGKQKIFHKTTNAALIQTGWERHFCAFFVCCF